MKNFKVTVKNNVNDKFRVLAVTAEDEKKAKLKVIYSLTGSDTVYDVREA